MKPFEIFRTGNHTAANGTQKEYTLEDLEQIADNYNRSEHEAPIVIGHPKNNAPAFGWIDKLFVEGDRLFAQAKDLVEDFVNAVKEKRFSKRSISLTKDGLLNHVGFLGAAVPAVKGLTDVEFSEQEELTSFETNLSQEEIVLSKDEEPVLSEVEATSSEDPASSNQQPDNQFKNYFENLSNQLDTIVTGFKEIVNKNNESNLQFAEENKEELDKLDAKLSDLRVKVDLSNFEIMLTEKVRYGYLTPAMKTKVMDILSYFDTLNFAETNTKDITKDIQNLLTEFVNSVPKVIEYEEVATDEEVKTNIKDTSFDDVELDPDSEALHNEILKTMKEDGTTYEEAFAKISTEKKS